MHDAQYHNDVIGDVVASGAMAYACSRTSQWVCSSHPRQLTGRLQHPGTCLVPCLSPPCQHLMAASSVALHTGTAQAPCNMERPLAARIAALTILVMAYEAGMYSRHQACCCRLAACSASSKWLPAATSTLLLAPQLFPKSTYTASI
jgi:hypothetical protein